MPRLSDSPSASNITDSESDSDIESIPRSLSPPQNGNYENGDLSGDQNEDPVSDYATGFFATPSLFSARRTEVVHVSAALINRPKRKADDAFDHGDGQTKNRRVGSSRQASVVVTSDVVPSPRDSLQLHPSFPKTAIQLFRQFYPDMKQKNMNGLFVRLASRPVKRVPAVHPKKFNNHKDQNIPSYFMQATGESLPPDESCEKCSKGLGPYGHACVIVRDAEVLSLTSGCCANCWYSRQGSLCTLRSLEGRTRAHRRNPDKTIPPPSRPASPQPPPVPRPQSDSTINPIQETHRPHPQSNGHVHQAAPAPAPHPSQPAPIHQQPRAATFHQPAPAQQPQQPSAPAPPGPARSGPETTDARVLAWETRYANMTPAALLEAQTHLAEWQEDLLIRSVALNRIMRGLMTQIAGRGGEGYDN
ncbi:hypothetical protein B0T25DRAFT_583075 [Lasiosphaeria hispida]|uniref:Uncharacterized protein n=1 Tax=Lasiosphaeria hispida TaxID=260671 RepID=A0AAJ0HGR7_9PEZI|nr:hypothetical protein B0T25DRAFT_583075 [Lasiosphaeria hispida]